MQKEENRNSLEVGKERVKNLLNILQNISKERYNNSITFEFIAKNSIAIRAEYKNKVVVLHPKAVRYVDDFAGMTLTTEKKELRKTEYGSLNGSLLLLATLDDTIIPKRYAVLAFNDLIQKRYVEYRKDRETFVRVHVNRIPFVMTLINGTTDGMLYQHPDVVEAIVKEMSK
jgi:hypothetical protein